MTTILDMYVFRLFSSLFRLCVVDVYGDPVECRIPRAGVVIPIVRFQQTADTFYQNFQSCKNKKKHYTTLQKTENKAKQ